MNTSKKLLIVVDMQNDFIFDALANKEASAIIPDVREKIKKCKSEDYTIVFTKDVHSKNYLDTEEGRNLPIEHCIKDTNGCEIVDYLKEFIDDSVKVFDKDTFGSKKLFKWLEVNNTNFEEIELIGVCTDICVIANTIIVKTVKPNAHIVVDAKCCAGVTPESHDIAIKAMKTLHIEIRNEGNEIWRNLDKNL